MPVGFSPKTQTAKVGVPIGMEVLGMPWTEGKLLGIAKEMDLALGGVRRAPEWARQQVEVKKYKTVPEIVSDTGSIPKEYPIGVLSE